MKAAVQEISVELAREVAYKLLSTCFDSPSEQWKEAKLLGGLADMLEVLKSSGYEDGLRLYQLVQGLRDFTPIQVAYAKLFIGPQKLLVPPYGSVYLEKRRVMGDSTMDVLRFYEKVGIGVSQETREIPDHIKIELEVMYYLIFHQNLALRQGDKIKADKYFAWQQEFFSNHLYPWVQDFSQALIDNSICEVYCLLGEVLIRFMAEEKSYYQSC